MDVIPYTTIMAFSIMTASSINCYADPIEVETPNQQYEIEPSTFTTPIEYNPYIQRLEYIRSLPDNWDGFKAAKIDIDAYMNSLSFIDCIDTNILSLLSEEDITPTPYGTITMDFRKGENVVSVEIGNKDIGFFTDFQYLEDLELESKKFNKNHLPEELEKALKILKDA